MSKKLELYQKRFGKLTVTYWEAVGPKNLWRCKCDCGNLVEVRGTHLQSGNTKSCGCLRKNGNPVNPYLRAKEALELVVAATTADEFNQKFEREFLAYCTETYNKQKGTN